MVDRDSILVVFWRDEGLREDGGRTKFRREITSRFWNSPADTVVKRFGFFPSLSRPDSINVFKKVV